MKWTVSVFSSIVEIKQNKARIFSKGIYNNIFHGVARHERMKSWVILTQNAILLYCLFLFIEEKTYILVFHFISYLTDHQIQMLKKRKCESFPHFQFLRCYVFCLRNTCFGFLYFSFLIVWKDLREVLLALVIFTCSSTKKQAKKKNKKKIQSYDRKVVVKQYIKLL